jgi:hypothetical protein
LHLVHGRFGQERIERVPISDLPWIETRRSVVGFFVRD